MAAICDLLYALLTVVNRKRHNLVVCIYVHLRLQIIVYMLVTYYFVLLFIQFKVIWGRQNKFKNGLCFSSSWFHNCASPSQASA